MNISEYVFIANKQRDALDEEIKQDFENHIFLNVWECFVEHLPTASDMEDDDCNSIDIWYSESANEILCRSEELADMIANILEGISGEREAHIGYYDPEEDERSGEVDELTGWWYVDFD